MSKYDYINLTKNDKYLVRFQDNKLIGLVSVISRKEAKNYASSFPHIKTTITRL